MLKQYIFHCAALVALVSFGGTASAQIAGGRSGSSSQIIVEGDAVWDLIRDFGSCFATRNNAEALEMVSTTPGSPEETALFRRIFSRNNQFCIADSGEVRAHPTLVRGAVAEALYRRGAPLPPSLVWTAPEAGAQARTLTDAVRCYVASNRAELRTLLERTRPGTRQEGRAISALMPRFSQCLPEFARRNRLHPTQLRFRFAEALWRMPEAGAGTVQPSR